MEEKIKINIPEGYEIDKEKSTFEEIVFKKKENNIWRNDPSKLIYGFYIDGDSSIIELNKEGDEDVRRNICFNHNVFATEKQVKSALAMARISQIMANDKRFGGVITNEEWNNESIKKYNISKYTNKLDVDYCYGIYYFLAFHTQEQRDLFLEENEDLVRDYLML